MAEHRHVCPWWIGYLLISPLRRWMQNPEKILEPYIKTGMTVMDVGSAMGFYSLPMAKMVGTTGKVLCIDLQEKMIKSLKKRAAKAGLSNRIETRLCSHDALGIEDMAGKIDFVLAFAVIHEVPDSERLLSEIHQAMKQDSHFLVAEPPGHVSDNAFKESIAQARRCGFEAIEYPEISRSHAALLHKKK